MVLQAKYARDQRWDFVGYLVVRGLILPGCAVCRASADLGSRELSFLLHEHVNDAEVVVRLIESNGFCRRHCAQARDHVALNYEDQLKIVLLYDHLVQSLHRRLGEQPQGVEAVAPRRDCTICTVERNAEAEIVDWLRDGLAVPELASLYAESSGLCLRHLFGIPAREPRLEAPIQAVLDAAGHALREDPSVPGPVGERVALFWGGGWDGDQTAGNCYSFCSVCKMAVTSENRALHVVADGDDVDGVLCRHHTRTLRTILAGREWPRRIIATMVERIDTRRQLVRREHPLLRRPLRALIDGGERPTVRDDGPEECPVCREVGKATVAALSQATASDVGENGCLGHIAALGQMQPWSQRALNASLRSRLERLVTRVGEACQFDRLPRAARRSELADLADRLTDLFAHSDASDVG